MGEDIATGIPGSAIALPPGKGGKELIPLESELQPVSRDREWDGRQILVWEQGLC